MNSLPQILHTLSYMGLPLLLAMVLHEYAHGWVAYRCGDSTAKLQGRLTMNPLAHIDPFGTIILPLICLAIPGGFFLGWAKPVPVDPRCMHQPRRDMALVAAAGPAMNLALAIVSALLFAILLSIEPTVGDYWAASGEASSPDTWRGKLLLPIAVMAVYSVLINVLLMLFNLLPLPPLDGGRILTSLLPPTAAMALMRAEPYGMFILMGLIILDPQIHLIHTVTGTLTNSLSNTILSTAVGLGTGNTP
ncbi:MAG: site-2 protease family protein [Nitrospirota bacterium]|nr:site-2 protease family protein [Nitrospirota bacterium]MDP2382398.1 site-2 protease family protein [Nitrospirota bacterium]MDP3598726.1 site-2 protease family protein [Nitrospirota bacterium]